MNRDFKDTPVLAPMAGKIIEVKIKPGDLVKEDQEIIVLEAMKMEMPIVAPGSGTIREVNAQVGQAVEADMVLAVIEF